MIRPIDMASRQARLAGVCLAVLLVACAERAGGGAGRTGVAWLDEPHDAVHLRLAYDSANSVSRVITEKGGTITATGADGSFFTLEIPAGALRRSERITMIPVRSVDGLPLEQGGALATVQLEPEGLWFDRPATLTIEVEKPVADAERLGFAWIAGGRDAHMYPARGGDSLEMVFTLVHFSGYGFGKAPPSDPGRIHLQNAASHAARLEARLAAMIDAERARQLTGTDEEGGAAELAEAFEKYLVEYYDAVVRPTMRIAEGDDRMAACAMRFYTQWMRFGLLTGAIGEDDPRAAAAGDQLATRAAEGQASSVRIMTHASQSAFARALKACKEEHDFTAFSRVVALYREMALTGGGEAAGNLSAEMQQFMSACLRFQVELVSDVTSRLPSGSSRFQVVATADYAAEGDPLGPSKVDNAEDAAPLNYRTLEISGNPMQDLGTALGADKASGLPVGDAAGDIARFAEKTMYYNLSKRGSRHGTVRVASVDWEVVTRDTIGTDCAGEDQQQKATVADSMKVTLRLTPPTEIVLFTPVHRSAHIKPFTAEMHEWMRFFTQFRQIDRDSSEVVDLREASGEDSRGERPKLIAIKLKQVESGAWRGELDTPEGTTLGAGLSESGHIILRHTPR